MWRSELHGSAVADAHSAETGWLSALHAYLAAALMEGPESPTNSYSSPHWSPDTPTSMSLLNGSCNCILASFGVV